MRPARPLPPGLGRRFSITDAMAAGVTRGRLRRGDLEAPFTGVRALPTDVVPDHPDPFARQIHERRVQAFRYAPRLRPGQFLSHESAIAIRGGPLPLVYPPAPDTSDPRTDAADTRLAPMDGHLLDVHVSTLGDGPIVRAAGVRGHRADPAAAELRTVRGFAIASPAMAWAQLGHLRLFDLVALGDFFCRVWREGYGRPDAGRPPWTTRDELRAMIARTRWSGIRRLREAIELIREDSWSPRESQVRCHLVLAGLPEPALNQDVYDDHGRFIGCVDLAYPDRKVAIEYHGVLHSAHYAADVERIAALRAAGWTVIEVTSALFAQPERLVARVRAALAR